MTTNQAPAGQASEDRERDDELGEILWNELRQPSEPYQWHNLVASEGVKTSYRHAAHVIAEHVRSDQAATIARWQAEYEELRTLTEKLTPLNLWSGEVNDIRADIIDWFAAHPAPPIETTGDAE